MILMLLLGVMLKLVGLVLSVLLPISQLLEQMLHSLLISMLLSLVMMQLVLDLPPLHALLLLKISSLKEKISTPVLTLELLRLPLLLVVPLVRLLDKPP